MASNRKYKAISLAVGSDYAHTGLEIRSLIDRLFPEIWEQLSATEQARLYKKYDLDILNWRIADNGHS